MSIPANRTSPVWLLIGTWLSVLLLASCNKVEEKISASEILSYVPAEAPVVMAFEVNDDIYPKSLIKKLSQAFDATVLFQREQLKLQLAQLQAQNPTENPEVIKKLQAFLFKWMDPAKVRQLGINPADMASAIYTVQMVPVIRAKLQPGHHMESFWDELFTLVEDLYTQSGASGSYAMEKIKVNDDLRYLVKINDVRIAVAINDRWLVLSMAPVAVYDKIQNQILGIEKPQQTFGDSDKFKKLRQQYGYLPGQVLWVDIVDLVAHMVDPANHPSAMVSYYVDTKQTSPVCAKEVQSLVGHFPRIVGGLTDIDEHHMASQVLWEMDKTLTDPLQAMEGEVPAFLPDTSMGFGVSINIPGSIQAITQLTQTIAEAPFQCPKLQPFNDTAKQLRLLAMRPLPPFVSQLKGFGLSLRSVSLNLENANHKSLDANQISQLGSAEIAIGVSFENVPALLGLAQLASPGLAKLNIKTDGTPVDLSELPEFQALSLPASLQPLWLAARKNHLVITAGIKDPDVVRQLATAAGDDVALKAEFSAELYQMMMQEMQSVENQLNSQSAPAETQKIMTLWRKYLQDTLWWQHQQVTLDFSPRGLETNMETRY